MKRFLITCAAFFLFLGITAIAPASKFKYSVNEGGINMKVTFPASFKSEKKVSDDYTSVNTQAIFDDIVFFVGHTSHNNELTDKKELRQISIEAFIDGLDAEIVEQNSWKVNKHGGNRATFEIPGNNAKGDYRVVIIGDIQYQVAVVAPEANWNENIALKFFKSFKAKG